MTEGISAKTAEEVAAYYATSDTDGLTSKEAAKRLKFFGQNRIYDFVPERRSRALAGIFFSPSGFLFLTAAVCAVAAGVSGALFGAVLYLAGVLALALVRARSQRIFDALKECGIPRAKIVRDGRPRLVDSRRLVPGDLVLYAAGDVVSADCRIVYENGLRVQETVGDEGYRVTEKTAAECPEAIAPSEMRNMLFANSTVLSGGARAIVTDTGRDTLVLTDSGGEPVALPGSDVSVLFESVQKEGRIRSAIGAGLMLLCALGILLSGRQEFLSDMLLALSALVFTVCGARDAVFRFAAASALDAAATGKKGKALVKNPGAVDGLAFADTIVIGEAVAAENAPLLKKKFAPYGVRVYITCLPESAQSLAAETGGRAFSSPDDALNAEGKDPVAVICRTPAERALLVSRLTDAGARVASVASVQGHLGMLTASSVSFCCTPITGKYKTLTDFSLDDIDRSAGNESMMKNADVLCDFTPDACLSAFSSIRALTKKLTAIGRAIDAAALAAFLTALFSLFSPYRFATVPGLLAASFSLLLSGVLMLAGLPGSALLPESGPGAGRARLQGPLSSVLWFFLLILTVFLSGRNGYSVRSVLAGVATLSLWLYIGFFFLFFPPDGVRGRVVIGRYLPLLLALLLAAAALFLPFFRDFITTSVNAADALLAFLPALAAPLMTALSFALLSKKK